MAARRLVCQSHNHIALLICSFFFRLNTPAVTKAMSSPTGSGSTNVMAELYSGLSYITANFSSSAFFFAIASSLAPFARAFSSSCACYFPRKSCSKLK